jgi:hypothetical protein
MEYVEKWERMAKTIQLENMEAHKNIFSPLKPNYTE